MQQLIYNMTVLSVMNFRKKVAVKSAEFFENQIKVAYISGSVQHNHLPRCKLQVISAKSGNGAS